MKKMLWLLLAIKDKLRSTVMKTSNSFSASANSSPFLTPDQSICGTVFTSCPAKS